MRFYTRKAPRSKAETLADRIGTGKCDDLAVSELKVAMAEVTDPAERERVLLQLREIVMAPGNLAATGYAIKALLALRPLADGAEGELELRARELITDPAAFSDRALQEAIAGLLYLRVSEKVDRAEPFTGALLQILDGQAGTGGTTAYNTLMIVAANRPELFQPHAGTLVRKLGSIDRETRLHATRLVAVLAMSHPEYVAGAEGTLQSISSFNPDGELKNSASEALQILSSRLRPKEQAPEAVPRHREQEPAGGLAEIMRRRAGVSEKKPAGESRIDKRLLSMATNFARKADRAYQADLEAEETEKETIGKIVDDFSEIAASIKAEASPTKAPEPMAIEAAAPGTIESTEEAELRQMMEKVKDDFSINAGSILDALGMGHLARKAAAPEVPVRDRPKRARPAKPEHVRPEPARDAPPAPREEEKEVNPREFIASIESILNQDVAVPVAAPVVGPAVTAADGAGVVVPENVAAAPGPEPPLEGIVPTPVADEAPQPPAEATPQVVEATPQATVTMPQDWADEVRPDLPKEAAKPEEPKPSKPPIVPSGVRITAMKFKSIDQSKSKKAPVPPKISIKPHIKPLSKTPLESTKGAPARSHLAADVPRPAEPAQEAGAGYIFCHSCNAKMPEDSQRCAICGSDLKAPKVRCRMCGEINPRGAGKCSRCNSLMEE